MNPKPAHGLLFSSASFPRPSFDEIEVMKSPTPDMRADSLGGSVTLKTRSPVMMKERRRITYQAAARWAPSFYDHTELRRDHPVHPRLSFGYQEVFDVFGDERNLGVSLNLFYSENVNSVGIAMACPSC